MSGDLRYVGQPKRLLADLERTQTPAGRGDLGAYSAEGHRLIERALRAGVPIRAIAVPTMRPTKPHPWAERIVTLATERAVPMVAVPVKALTEQVGGRTFGTMVALIDRPEPRSIGAFLTQLPRTAGPQSLVAVDVRDPGNLGALMRTAAANGVRGFVTMGGTDPWHPKAIRTSMGAIFRLTVIALRDMAPAALFQAARSSGFQSIGAVVDAPITLPCPAPTHPLLVVMGSEAHGLPADAIAALDQQMGIPMAAGIDSLSINAAAAVMLYALSAAPR